jgi:hydrogenase maturation protein HypF
MHASTAPPACGGVFQNTTLLKLVTEALARQQFEILTHRKVPPDDGGLGRLT